MTCVFCWIVVLFTLACWVTAIINGAYFVAIAMAAVAIWMGWAYSGFWTPWDENE